jgi:hypothetical protein
VLSAFGQRQSEPNISVNCDPPLLPRVPGAECREKRLSHLNKSIRQHREFRHGPNIDAAK